MARLVRPVATSRSTSISRGVSGDEAGEGVSTIRRSTGDTQLRESVAGGIELERRAVLIVEGAVRLGHEQPSLRGLIRGIELAPGPGCLA